MSMLKPIRSDFGGRKATPTNMKTFKVQYVYYLTKSEWKDRVKVILARDCYACKDKPSKRKPIRRTSKI